jgi:hypothetical protein
LAYLASVYFGAKGSYERHIQRSKIKRKNSGIDIYFQVE